jgi:hypothetical protein
LSPHGQRKIEQLAAALNALLEAHGESRIAPALTTVLAELSRIRTVGEAEANMTIADAETLLDQARNWLVGEPARPNEVAARSLFVVLLAEARGMVDDAMASEEIPDARAIAKHVVSAHADVPDAEEYRDVLEREAYLHFCTRKIS